MQYTIKTATDPQVYLGQKQQRVVHWMKNAAFFCMIASMILSVYAFRTDIVEAYTAFKTSLQVDSIDETTADSSIIYFEPDSTNLFGLFKSNLAVLNRGTYKLYSPDGSELFAIQLGYASPGLSISDNFVVAFDRGNRAFSVYEQRSLVNSMEAEGTIISLSQNKDGFIAVVHNDETYRGAVSVYDNYQNLVYQWKTSDYYLLRAAVSPDGRHLAAVALTQEDGIYRSKIVIFRLDEEQRHAEYDLESTVIADMHFMDTSSICLIGDEQSIVLDMDGNVLADYLYGSDSLKTCAKGNGFVVLATVDASSGLGSKLVKLSASGVATYETEDEVRKVSASGDYVGVLYTSSVQMLSGTMQELTRPVEVYQVRDILTNDDGKLMLIYSAEAGFVDVLTPFLG